MQFFHLEKRDSPHGRGKNMAGRWGRETGFGPVPAAMDQKLRSTGASRRHGWRLLLACRVDVRPQWHSNGHNIRKSVGIAFGAWPAVIR